MLANKDITSCLEEAEVILFDLDDTLLMSTHADKIAISESFKILKEYVIAKDFPTDRWSNDDLWNKLIRIKDKKFPDRPHPDYDLFSELMRDLGFCDKNGRVNSKEVSRMNFIYQEISRVSQRLYPDVIPFIKNLLVKLQIPLGIITNGDTYYQNSKLIKCGIVDFFETIVISDEIGMRKPDPDIFRYTCDSLGANIDKSIFIGDRPDRDIKGANDAGMVSIRIKRADGKYGDIELISPDMKPMFEYESLDEINKHLLSISIDTAK